MSVKSTPGCACSTPTASELVTKHIRRLGFRVEERHGSEYVRAPVSLIPPGPFVMGSLRAAHVKAYEDEMPVHEVGTSGYGIGTFPMTVAEYSCALRAGVVSEPKPFRGTTWAEQISKPDHPVTSISWFDAISYCLWLGDLTGELWSLPTEAEWEKAARGTDGRVYPWGNDWDPDQTNTPDGGSHGTTPIDAYPESQSPYGVWDMIGNVWEWTSSIYQPYPYQLGDGREDFSIVADRVMRGSAWYCTPFNARAACRGIGYAGLYMGGGFRLVLHQARE